MGKKLLLLSTKLVQCLMALLVLCPSTGAAEPGEIEYEDGIDLSQSYMERRTPSGALFSFLYETQEFGSYISTLDSLSFSEKYGKNISIYGLNINKKFNWKPASLSVGLGYSMGSQAKGDAKISMQKTKITSRISFDGLGEEPHWTPFVGADLYEMYIQEEDSTDSFSGKVDLGYQWSLGLSVQLNRIDYGSSKQAYAEWGLENTFLDIYIFGNGKPLSGDEVGIDNSVQTGFALTLEF